MNPIRAIVVSIFALLPWMASGQVFLGDDFSILRYDYWQPSSYGVGSYEVGLDWLHLTDRGRITTNATNWAFDQPILAITGTIFFTSSDDIFNVVLRSSGSYDAPYGETANGLKVSFGPYGGGALALNEIAYVGEGGTQKLFDDFVEGGLISEFTYDFVIASTVSESPDPNLFFGIGPTGTEFPVVPLGRTSGSYGSRVGFYNREYTDQSHTVVVSALTITGTAIPEPSVTAVLFGAVGLMGAWHRRRRRLAAGGSFGAKRVGLSGVDG